MSPTFAKLVLALLLLIVTVLSVGAVASTIIEATPALDTFPAASATVAVAVYVPVGNVDVVTLQDPVLLAVAV